MIVGGVVRVVDAGLGCGPAGGGLRGWPLCDGRLVPNVDTHTLVEYTHRFLATVVVILLVAILWQALRRFRSRPALGRWAIAGLLLVLAQAVLGGLTVEYGLHAGFVAAHLGTAMLLLGILIALFAATGPRRETLAAELRLRPVAIVACVLLLATIVAGGVIAGTENHGVPGGERIWGAHFACGHEFPACNGSFLPFGSADMLDIQLTHRSLMFLAVLAITTLALLLHRRRLTGRLPLAIGAVLAAQVLLGAINVWADESGLLVLAHLTTGTLLWMLVASAMVSLANLGTTTTGEYGDPPGLDKRGAATGSASALAG